jgi:hypothetical protein
MLLLLLQSLLLKFLKFCLLLLALLVTASVNENRSLHSAATL